MKYRTLFRLSLAIAACGGLTSCYQSCAVGDPLGFLTYCPRETREALRHPKPYRDYWTKFGMTEESRTKDWVECGGDADGGFSMHVKKMLPGETNETSRLRQTSEFKACLTQRGYHYEITRN
jgi:hypothetical protein